MYLTPWKLDFWQSIGLVPRNNALSQKRCRSDKWVSIPAPLLSRGTFISSFVRGSGKCCYHLTQTPLLCPVNAIQRMVVRPKSEASPAYSNSSDPCRNHHTDRWGPRHFSRRPANWDGVCQGSLPDFMCEVLVSFYY